MATKLTIKDNEFTITGTLETVHDSATGKTVVLFSTHGNQPMGAVYDGKPIVMGLNMYVRK